MLLMLCFRYGSSDTNVIFDNLLTNKNSGLQYSFCVIFTFLFLHICLHFSVCDSK